MKKSTKLLDIHIKLINQWAMTPEGSWPETLAAEAQVADNVPREIVASLIKRVKKWRIDRDGPKDRLGVRMLAACRPKWSRCGQ